jgi:hypothetical protein
MKNEQREYITDLTGTSSAQTITWTTNEPTASTLMTIADGSAPTSTEIGQYIANNDAQMTLVTAELAALRTAINS